MGKSTINGHFQQLCSKLPEGNSNFGWSSLPWPSYHWPPNWSEAPSLLCMFQCLFRSGKLSHRKAWISQPFFHGFPWVSSNIFLEPILRMLFETYKTPLAFEVSSASTRQSMPWTSRIRGPCSLATLPRSMLQHGGENWSTNVTIIFGW